jgi:hypothetical protein
VVHGMVHTGARTVRAEPNDSYRIRLRSSCSEQGERWGRGFLNRRPRVRIPPGPLFNSLRPRRGKKSHGQEPWINRCRAAVFKWPPRLFATRCMAPAQAVASPVHITAHVCVQEVFARRSPGVISARNWSDARRPFFNPGLFRHELKLRLHLYLSRR